jgi:hypothetical protein
MSDGSDLTIRACKTTYCPLCGKPSRDGCEIHTAICVAVRKLQQQVADLQAQLSDTHGGLYVSTLTDEDT